MKVLNLIWGFTLGAGIDKCFLTYARLGEVDKDVDVISVCINLQNLNSHIEPLLEIGTEFINIKSRRDFSWIWKLKKRIDKENPDVIFTHGFNGAIMMLLERVFMRMRVSVVCSYHGAYHAPTKLKKLMEPLYNSLPIWIYKRIAKRVICVENRSRYYLCSKGVDSDKVVTVHNGIMDIPVQSPVNLSTYIDESVPTLLTASRITEVKGLPYLLHALKILKDKGLKFHYFMIGEGPDLHKLKVQCHSMGLDSVITFMGYQSNVAEWLAACDIFVLPSLYEYHSIAVLEAMRSGKAIVATTVGGNTESITNGVEGLMVPPADSGALAAAIEKLLVDIDARVQFGFAARRRFEKEFTEIVMMRNLIRVLKS